MIFISSREMDAILNRKIRKRTLELLARTDRVRPAKHPKIGRVLAAAKPSSGAHTKRCPLREGGTYMLVERQPYDQWRRAAGKESTRAWSVLWWIARCEQAPRKVEITVLKVDRVGPVWIVRFAREKDGEVKDHIDTHPVFLARGAGYTVSDEIGAGEVLGPLREDMEEARRKMREERTNPQRQNVRTEAERLGSLRESLENMKARELVRRAQRNLEAAERVLSADDVSFTVRTAADGSPGEAERPPSGASSASLKDAA